jgi:hypothetical protein
MTIEISVNRRRDTVHITRFACSGPGTTRRYRNVSKASIARLFRLTTFFPVGGGAPDGAVRGVLVK